VAHTHFHPVETSKGLFWKRPGKRALKRIGTALLFLLLWAVGVWLLKSTPVIDLGAGGHWAESGISHRWARGQVVVMIRHAERCDRSDNPCLGSHDGITRPGSQAATAVGNGLRQTLGLANADLIASPLARTRQTAEYIFGSAIASQSWVGECDGGFENAVLAHKKAHENLVLITHSGCIDHFERKLGVRAGQRDSAYAQAFFVAVDGKHPPRMLGTLDAEQWARLAGN
jgi:phosphohistidine phosphatase SixA